ncbi:MAG: hypothetical protein NZM06_00940 [Chloroherpetonaceae bacterium]|nr:hypothetical protein [Chloroherpetonaceae bacterium]MDW8438766.1 hypothetical protein [Chloroherpetonaceae bacterium]
MSIVFEKANRETIEKRVAEILNGEQDFLSRATANSPRAVGDAIQEILSEHFGDLIKPFSEEYSPKFARRAMADFAFTDKDGNYCVVDVKTHREGTHFNMPNLTSVERLARFYEDDKNHFAILFIRYAISETRLSVSQSHFVPIEYLSWECLTIGALGWGQIQLANANRLVIDENATRKKWMLELCDAMLEFYPKEIEKISERTEYFKKVKARWQQR